MGIGDAGLFRATVPVFLHYLGRLNSIIAKAPDTALASRLTEDTGTAAEHFATAQGFTLRTVFPLIGRDAPELPETALAARADTARAHLTPLTEADFAGATTRTITHTAGFAELRQTADTFATCYGLPNFFFHLTFGYATLRAQGVSIGKSDFDGQHSYPPGFRF
ncbi:DUF1993 family protein [Algicella marina]|uniref:DUF1993 family protein n=1 Tax=Algicella marina TaxID=2683284 RepID=A0A6P1SUM5_9RHOB|nr:DUF1993 family protein [Algicella marina]QHQ34148.1 DUF1993 family protein [Algicella marina]